MNLSGLKAEASGGLAQFALRRACDFRDIPPSYRLILPSTRTFPCSPGDVLETCDLELTECQASKTDSVLLQILPHVSFARFLANVGTAYLIIKDLLAFLAQGDRERKRGSPNLPLKGEDCGLGTRFNI